MEDIEKMMNGDHNEDDHDDDENDFECMEVVDETCPDFITE